MIGRINRLEETLNRPAPNMATVIAKELSDERIAEITAISDVVEFRADKYPIQGEDYLIAQVQRFAKVPMFATIRIQAEGGEWVGSEDDRFILFRSLLPHVDGVDVELESEIMPRVIETAHENGKVVVVSSHDFSSTPSVGNLLNNYWRANDAGADYVKIAATAKTQEQFDRLAGFVISHREENIIVVDMGKMCGRLSRIVFPAMGSHLTYASSGGDAVAPGQMDFKQMKEQLDLYYPTAT
jgi:3-dehydroquinate dehydratase-1